MKTQYITRIENELENLNITCTEEKARLLLQYMEMVLERNKKVNLTAITEPEEFIEKHYVDSLACGALPEFQGARRVIDVGTGGGFPGVPLAIAYPEKEFVLVDSLNKRIRIIQEFCEELRIGNVTAIHGRAEELGRQSDLRDGFDVCVSRAVADLRVLAEYCLPFVKKDGWFIAYKSVGCEEEIAGAERAIKMLGARIDRSELVGASGQTQASKAETREHQLILIRKLISTPAAYPRRPGTPAKKPL